MLPNKYLINYSLDTGTTSGNSDGSGSLSSASSANEAANIKQQRQQAVQQQQNAIAQALMVEKIKNTLGLLANGFNKQSGSGVAFGGASFNLMRGAASSLAATANNVVNNSSGMKDNNLVNLMFNALELTS